MALISRPRPPLLLSVLLRLLLSSPSSRSGETKLISPGVGFKACELLEVSLPSVCSTAPVPCAPASQSLRLLGAGAPRGREENSFLKDFTGGGGGP